jgi:predicted molibdopterin-dependent oxidoreductase YjgC
MTTSAERHSGMKTLSLQVNGVAVESASDSRVLDALRKAGFNVPTLCFDERVGPKGTCRMCLVEVEVDGRKQTVASCTAFAQDGMKVETHTPVLRDYRKTLLEMLLSETSVPKRFPADDKTAHSEFYRALREYEARSDAFPKLDKRKPAPDPNPFIQRDYDLCIACYRCTNICNEWEQAGAITVDGRGQDSSIFSFFNNNLLDSPCTFCGQCINTCPTGALTDRKLAAKHDPFEAERTKTICPYCGVGCGIELITQDSELIGSQPDFDAPSRGSLCVKGQFASWEFVRSEERLKFPLIRKDGVLQRASWDEALDLVAANFKRIIAEDGPDAIVCWASARVVTEANYLLQKFARTAIGTNNIDNCSRT